MAIIQDDLNSAVGAKIDIVIDVNSVPSESQVQRWAIDGAQKIASILSPERAGALMDTEVVDITDGDSMSPANFIRLHKVIFSVKIGEDDVTTDVPGIFVEDRVFDTYKMMGWQFAADRPGYTVIADTIHFSPPINDGATSGESATAHYIKRPMAIGDIPAEWLGAVSSYAAAHARQQDDELNAFSALYSEFRQDMATIAGAPAEQKG